MARLEKSGEPPAQLPPERAGGGVRSSPEAGTACPKGRGDSLNKTAKAVDAAGPAVRTRRFGALEGGAPFTRESESHPGERAYGREAKFLRDRWEVGPPSLANAGNGDRQTCPAAEASRITEASAIESAKAPRWGMADGSVSRKRIRIRVVGGAGRFRGDAPQPQTVRHRHLPSDGRYRASTRATELNDGAPAPIPVCAGIAARRPARVVNGIWKRAGSFLAGERREPKPNSVKR